MNLTNLRKQLEIDEGCVYEIYLDHLGLPTFGIGHLIVQADPEYGKPIGTPVSEERVQEAFDKDIAVAIVDVEKIYGLEEFYSWPQEVQEILVNMAFNLGRTRLSKFVNFRKALKERDWPKAAHEMRDSKWFYQVGDRSFRLYSRMKEVK